MESPVFHQVDHLGHQTTRTLLALSTATLEGHLQKRCKEGNYDIDISYLEAWGHWPGCCIWHVRSEDWQIRQTLLLIAQKIITITWSQTLLSHQRKFLCSQAYKNDTWHNHPWWSDATIQTGHRDKQRSHVQMQAINCYVDKRVSFCPLRNSIYGVKVGAQTHSAEFDQDSPIWPGLSLWPA